MHYVYDIEIVYYNKGPLNTEDDYRNVSCLWYLNEVSHIRGSTLAEEVREMGTNKDIWPYGGTK
jgi:hypothetical protein